jgi:hypothetical protein
MKKRSRRDIPDYSRQAPPSKEKPAISDSGKSVTKPNQRPTVKPQATSAKSGRRGQ